MAALYVKGMTIHDLFRLPLKGGGDMEELGPAGLAGCQGYFKDVKYLIIDEKSMISLHYR
jgi:hypothetical protein